MQALFAHILNQGQIEAFQGDRPVGHNLRNMVGGKKGIRKAKHQERTCRGTINETHGGLKYSYAGAFGADKRPCDVKAVFWQQLVEVVTRNATRNVRKAF